MAHEALGRGRVGGVEDAGAVGVDRFGAPVVHVSRRHQPDPAVAMHAVVPGEELAAERAGMLDGVKPRGERHPNIAEAQTAIVECPSCGQETWLLDDGAACLFCGAAATAQEGADDYAHLVLGASFYESGKQGIDWVVSSCPECQAETLVDRGPSGDVKPADQWVCFTCGTTWSEGSLGHCDRCGELISAGEDEMSICGDCFRALVAKE